MGVLIDVDFKHDIVVPIFTKKQIKILIIEKLLHCFLIKYKYNK